MIANLWSSPPEDTPSNLLTFSESFQLSHRLYSASSAIVACKGAKQSRRSLIAHFLRGYTAHSQGGSYFSRIYLHAERNTSMAHREHLDRLNQGIGVWNAWRRQHPAIQPDLSGAYLAGANLRGANLTNANLAEANLR